MRSAEPFLVVIESVETFYASECIDHDLSDYAKF